MLGMKMAQKETHDRTICATLVEYARIVLEKGRPYSTMKYVKTKRRPTARDLFRVVRGCRTDEEAWCTTEAFVFWSVVVRWVEICRRGRTSVAVVCVVDDGVAHR